MENANLSEMIKDDQAPVFETDSLDIPPAGPPIEESVDEPTPEVEAVPTVESIQIAPLNAWFEANSSAFANISEVKVAIRGIDPSKTLIMAVMDGQGEVEGNPSRDLQVFKNADSQPVLNIPANDMQIYNNGFRLIYPYDDIAIKAYGVRTGLICVFCNIISDTLVPYQVVKVKKKDTFVEVPRLASDNVTAALAQNADMEAVQLLYKQISKAAAEMQTNSAVVTWLLTRQSEVTDINHHLQIDNVIIDILS